MSDYQGKVERHESTFAGRTSVTITWSLGECDVECYSTTDGNESPRIRVNVGEPYLYYGDVTTDGNKFTPEQARALAHDLPLILTELAELAELAEYENRARERAREDWLES